MQPWGGGYGSANFNQGATERRMNENNIQMPGDWCTITYYECDVQVKIKLQMGKFPSV